METTVKLVLKVEERGQNSKDGVLYVRAGGEDKMLAWENYSPHATEAVMAEDLLMQFVRGSSR
jgi:hypothetical protein